jgi:hypothetical protein
MSTRLVSFEENSLLRGASIQWDSLLMYIHIPPGQRERERGVRLFTPPQLLARARDARSDQIRSRDWHDSNRIDMSERNDQHMNSESPYVHSKINIYLSNMKIKIKIYIPFL